MLARSFRSAVFSLALAVLPGMAGGAAASLATPPAAVSEPALGEGTDCEDLPEDGYTPESLPEGTNVDQCALVGEDVESDGLILEVPEPGTGVRIEHIYPNRNEVFSISVDGDGSISYEVDASAAPDGDEPSGTPECSQGDAFNLKEQQSNTWNWYIGDGSYPAALSYTAFRDIAQTTINNLKSAHNNCGFSDKISQLSTSFRGADSHESDFVIKDGVSVCASRDGVSVLDAGNLDDNGSPPLAAECTYTENTSARPSILESDVRFNIANYDFTTTPGNCDNKWDVQAVLTHEFGHSVGLGHVSEASYPLMTMSPLIDDCSATARTLGKGDIHGLQLLYCLNQNCHYVD